MNWVELKPLDKQDVIDEIARGIAKVDSGRIKEYEYSAEYGFREDGEALLRIYLNFRLPGVRYEQFQEKGRDMLKLVYAGKPQESSAHSPTK